MATQDVAAADLRVARAQAGFDRAVQAQAAGAGDADGRLDAGERLATVEAALVVQADRAVEAQAPYLATVLGARPESSRGRATWDAGAQAVERYRHVHLGLSPDVDLASDPGAAIGTRPEGGAPAAAFDDTVGAILRVRAELLLADIAAHAPDTPYEASPAARLAARRLPSLVAELERTHSAVAKRAVAERRASAAAAALDAARADVTRAATPPAAAPARRWGRASSPPPVDADALAQAQRQLRKAEAAAQVADAALAATAAPPPDHAATVQAAITLRSRHVVADALHDPPAWLRADVAERVAAHPVGHAAIDPERLARAYGKVATYAERSRLAGAERIEDILTPDPLSEGLMRHRIAVLDDLGPDLAAGVEAGVDLGL